MKRQRLKGEGWRQEGIKSPMLGLVAKAIEEMIKPD